MPRQPAVPGRPASRNPPWWMTIILVLGALGVLSLAYGALLAPQTLLAAGQHMNGAAHVWARYAAVYALALGVTLLALIAIRSRRILAGVLVQAALAELLLGVVGIVERRWEQVAADVILVAVFFGCATWLFGQPPWQAAAWRDSSQPGT